MERFGVDPMVSLALSVVTAPGTYALLLGSGVSKAAGIPTGWDVTLHLVRKAVAAEGEDASGNPRGWHQERFGKDPVYSEVIDGLAKSQAERRNLLKEHFEPTETEREEGKKVPTAAHEAIARLAAGGYVSVILTTNFDKLMERALETENVTPAVLDTPDAIKGAQPLQHAGVTVVKVNGDYLDTRIKNTTEELEEYDVETDRLLDKIFDEYGLVICGWSGVSDTALKDALKRARSRRYATYWVSRGEPDEESRQLAESLDGVVVRSEGADQFFKDLEEKVAALESLQEGDPLTPAVAVATVKRYLEEDRYRIRLRDFLVRQSSELRDSVFSRDDFPVTWDGSPEEELPGKVRRRLRSYDVLLGPALGVLVAGAYWARGEQVPPFAEPFRAVASPPHDYSQFFEVWQDLDLYPALRLFYGVGIASALAQNWGLLRILARDVTVENLYDYRPHPAAFVLDGGYLSRNLRWENHTSLVYPDQTYYLPLTEYLYQTLEEPLREYASDPASYNRAFEEFEVLLSLMSMNVGPASSPESAEAPRGRFVYDRRLGGGDATYERMKREAMEQDADWGPIRAGLIQADAETLEIYFRNIEDTIRHRRH